MKIFKLRNVVLAHHAMLSKKKFFTDSDLEINGTVAMEMFVGKAYEYGLGEDIMLAENWTDGRILALKTGYEILMADPNKARGKRYRIKGVMIDRAMENQD